MSSEIHNFVNFNLKSLIIILEVKNLSYLFKFI